MKHLRGLYAITSQRLCADPALLGEAVAAALRGGAVMIQYRDKWSEPQARRRNAAKLAALCHDRGARFIVNDDPALAAQCGADGVHLGAADAPLAQARAQLRAGALIGLTCSNSAPRIEAAAAQRASYAALGRFYASSTKPQAPPATIEQLRLARARHPQLALCAIGGITPDNAAPLIAAGADLIAAVEGVFGAADVESAARAYSCLF